LEQKIKFAKRFSANLWKTPEKKTVFSRLSGTKRNFFAHRVAIYITGTPFKNKWATKWGF